MADYTEGEYTKTKRATGDYTLWAGDTPVGIMNRHFDADRIITCVNTHDAMYEALKAWSELGRKRPRLEGANIDNAVKKCVIKTEQALALVKEVRDGNRRS